MDPPLSDLYWHGLHVSLYRSLPRTSVSLLEEAIANAKIGDFPSALRIFDVDLAPVKHEPVVAIEHAEALLHQGRWELAGKVLREALGAPCRASEVLKQGEDRLMRLSLGLTEIIAEGKPQRAQEETRDIRSWLGGVPVEEYTDIMVSCIRRYYATISFITLTTFTSDLHVVGRIPSPTEAGASPWQGLTDLRESLFRQGRIREASALLVPERASKPFSQRPATVQAYLDAYKCLDPQFLGDPALLRIQAEGRLVMAQVWEKSGEAEKANAELEEATALSRRYLESRMVQEKSRTAPLLEIQHVRLKLVPEDELQTRWVDIKKFIEAASEACHFSLLSKAYRDAAEIAYGIFEQGSIAYLDEFLKLHQEREICQSCKMGDLFSLVEDHAALVIHGFSHEADLRKAIEWYDGFERDHPDFCLPSSIYDKECLKFQAYGVVLGDSARAELARKEMSRWEANPTSEGENVGLISVLSAGWSQEERDMGEWLSEKHYPASIVGRANRFGRSQSEVALSILLSWIKREVVDGFLDVKELLSIPAISDQQDLLSNCQAGDPVGSSLPADYDWSFMTVGYLRTAIFGSSGKPLEEELWRARFNAIMAWLERSLSVSDAGTQRMNISLRQSRIWSLTESTKPAHERDPERVRRTEQALIELQHCIDMFPTLNSLVKYAIGSKLSMWLWRMGRYKIEIVQLSGKPLISECSRQNVTDAYRLYTLATEHSSNSGDLFMVGLHTDMAIARWLWKMAGVAEKPDCNIRAALDHLRDAETILTDVRYGLNLVGGEDTPVAALEGFEGFGNSHPSWRLSEIAVQIIHSSGSCGTGVELWDWVQRSKARALASLLGSSIPQMVVADLDDECRGFIDKEMKCLEDIREADPRGRFHLRTELRRIQSLMRGRSEKLDTMMDMRDGVPITSQGLEDLMSDVGLEGGVVFVDWFHAPPLWSEDVGADLYMVVAKRGANKGPGESGIHIRTYPLEIRLTTVKAWAQTYLTGDLLSLRREDSHGLLKTLKGLVEPLAEATSPEDVLIFCPTNILQSVPLHALIVGEEILMRRNPIVYCHSLSTLRYSRFSAQQKEKAPSSKPYEVAIFADPGYSAQLKWGRHVAETLGKQFGVTPVTGEAVTKETLVEQCTRSQLVHFHGHCSFTTDRPLLHRIKLYSPEPRGEDPLVQEGSRVEDGKDESGLDITSHSLTAREVLDLALLRGSHITLIACQTGGTRVSPGDEAQGFVPAFLYSGASSAVSTLWNVTDESGAKFSMRFYERWRGGGPQSFINLARAHQEAVVALSLDTDLVGKQFNNRIRQSFNNTGAIPVYYWAAFILHGWWHLDARGTAS
ncbi:MAG: hypothetical protein M1813_005250 [Trichoglossum hirsutum]|nr:MAG: hypothetical protein M1813_005250 [Trichoglossum hirsutum]